MSDAQRLSKMKANYIHPLIQSKERQNMEKWLLKKKLLDKLHNRGASPPRDPPIKKTK